MSVQCQGHGVIENKLSVDQITHVCGALQAGAAGGVTAVVGFNTSKVCIERGTGHTIENCQTTLGIASATGSSFAYYEVNAFCSRFLNLFVTCKGGEGKIDEAGSKKLILTAFNTEKHHTCVGADENCIKAILS